MGAAPAVDADGPELTVQLLIHPRNRAVYNRSLYPADLLRGRQVSHRFVRPPAPAVP